MSAADELLAAPAQPSASAAPPAVNAYASVATGAEIILTANDLALARESWIEAGHDAAKFDEATKSPGVPAADAPEFSPAQYRPDYGEIGRSIPVEQLGAFHAETTTWLSKLGLEPSIGKALIEHSMAQSRAYSAMTPSERALHSQSQRIEAERQAGGKEQLTEAIKRAGAALRRCGPSELTAALLERGAFDAWTVLTLSNSELLREARAKAKP
jgi:hypothetical protein